MKDRLALYTDHCYIAPVQEPTFLILTALAVRPQHGYGVIQEVGALSDGRVRLRAGTLYAALDRLVGEGLVERDREEVVNGRLRQYYRLTDPGAQALTAEVDRQRANVEIASRRLRLRASGAQA